MTQHTVFDDLSIPPRPLRSYSIERTLANPQYWRGAIHCRQSLGDTGRGLLLCAQIERDLIAGKALSNSAAYGEWRTSPRALGDGGGR